MGGSTWVVAFVLGLTGAADKPDKPDRTDKTDKTDSSADASKAATQDKGDATAKSGDSAQPAGAAQAESTGEEDTTVHGLSWDLLGGGIPSSGALIEGGLGFSGLPKIAYHHSLDSTLSVGGSISFDYAYWAPKAAFSPSLLLQVPVRYALYHTQSLSIGVRADPGLGFFFNGGPRASGFGILANVGASLGYTLQDRFIVGGGVDVPMALVFPSGGTVDLSFPILFGPLFEFHVTPPLALIFNLRVGPHLNSAGSTLFGLEMMSGIAYRL